MDEVCSFGLPLKSGLKNKKARAGIGAGFQRQKLKTHTTLFVG